MTPGPASAMLPFRLLLFAAALLLSSALFPGAADAKRGWEITPYAGYAIGGNFEDNTTGADLDVKDGGSFGLVLGVPDTTEVFCVSSGGAACSVRVKGDVLGQVLLMAGITFSL